MPTPGRPAAPGIFISYRRGDGDHAARTIYQRLSTRFGRDRVFLDVDNLRPGAHFPQEIDRALQSCAVCIAVIGDRWLTGGRSNLNRLTSPTDFVRIELAAALRRPNLAVFPVLVSDEVKMPSYDVLPDDLQELPSRQAVRIPNDYFEAGMAELLKEVDGALVAARRRQKIDTLLMRARHAFEAGDYETAITSAEELLELEPEEPNALELLDRTRSGAEAAGERNEAIRIAVDQARKRLAEGDWDEAIRHADEALALNPGLTEARELRSKAEAAQQQRLREREGRRAQQQGERLRVQEEQQRRDAAARQAEAQRTTEAQRAAETKRTAEAKRAAEALEAVAREAAAAAVTRAREETDRTAHEEPLAREEADRVAQRHEADPAPHAAAAERSKSTALSTKPATPTRMSRRRLAWIAAAGLVFIAAITSLLVWHSSRLSFYALSSDLLDSIAITADQKLMTASNAGLKSWDLQNRRDVPIPGPSLGRSARVDVFFDRSGTILAFVEPDATLINMDGVSSTGKVIVWQVGRGMLRQFEGLNVLLALSADGKYIARRSEALTVSRTRPPSKSRGPIEVRDIFTDEKVEVPGRNWDWEIEAALSENGEYVAVGRHGSRSGGDGPGFQIEIWQIGVARDDGSVKLSHSPVKINSWMGTDPSIFTLAFSPDGRHLAGISLEPNQNYLSTVHLWERTRSVEVGSAPAGSNLPWHTLAFSPDGQSLAAGGDHDTVRVLTVPRLSGLYDSLETQTLRCGCGGAIKNVVFSPDGNSLVASGYDPSSGVTPEKPMRLTQLVRPVRP